jgi:hypothetical protein
MCANAHPGEVRLRTICAGWDRPSELWKDPMTINRRSRSSPDFREFSLERRPPAALVLGLSLVALAGCASAIFSLAAMH